MGPSGSGKSTAMNMIGCLDTPTSGQYLFAGVDVGELDRDQRALLRRQFIGFVFQGFNLLPRTSAVENVELPLIYRGLPLMKDEGYHSRLLRAWPGGSRKAHAFGTIGRPTTARAIARAIVSDPAILVADEPTGNLDTRTSEDILKLLTSLNQDRGITIIMVTHEAEMASYARRTIRFLDGTNRKR